MKAAGSLEEGWGWGTVWAAVPAEQLPAGGLPSSLISSSLRLSSQDG